MAYEKIIIQGFPGGITDKPEDGNIKKAEELDNVVLRDNGTPLTREGSQQVSSYTYRMPNSVDAKLVLEYDDDKVYFGGSQAYVDNGTALTELTGANSSIALFPGATVSNYHSHIEWKDQFLITTNLPSRPLKVFKEDTNGWTAISAGLPKPVSGMTVAVTGGTGAASAYLFGIGYKYDYTIDNVLYTMRGPIRKITVTGQSTVGDVTYSSIPELTNVATTHYDVSNLRVELYRTLENGQNLYHDGEIANGDTTLVTNTVGEGIVASGGAYTNGGVLNNDPPPICKYIVEAQNYTYYLGLDDDPSKILEAKANIIDGVPEGNSAQLDQKVTASGVIYDDVFAMTKDRWYRLDGHYSETGTGNVIPRLISNADGILYNQSLSNGTYGLFGAGQKGFVFCNGEKVIPITDFDELYKILKDNSSATNQIVGTFDQIKKRMLFACKRKSQAETNDSIFVMHEKLGIRPDSSFTTFSGGKYFNPTYIQILKNNTLFRGDSGGYLLNHSEDYKWDIQYKASTLPTSWLKEAIRDKITTVRLYGEDPTVNKWGVKVLLQANNLTNLSIQPSCASNGSSNFKPMSKIDTRTQISWDEEHIYWEDAEDNYWNDSRDIIRMIRMPKGYARFQSRQLRFEKALSVLYSPAENYAANVTIDTSSNTITFNGEVPETILERYILTTHDGYTEKYLIIQEISSNKFKISNPNSTLVDGTYEWQIKGYPLYQLFNPFKIIMYYAKYGESFGIAADATGMEANG